MSSVVENITFMIVRGVVALAIVGLGFYCIAQGIHFFLLTQIEAEQLQLHLFGLDITATGLGAIIFGTGIALSYIGKRTLPRLLETTESNESEEPQRRDIPSKGYQAVSPIAPAAHSSSVAPALASKAAPLLPSVTKTRIIKRTRIRAHKLPPHRGTR